MFKKRFKIFDKISEYLSDIQIKLIIILAGLYNYIREIEKATENDLKFDLKASLDKNMKKSEDLIRLIQNGGSTAINRLRD